MSYGESLRVSAGLIRMNFVLATKNYRVDMGVPF